jgi:hypothetical protein
MARLLNIFWLAQLLACDITSSALAQFTAPQNMSYGSQQVLQVAPDGAVHLDGPYSAYSNPTYTVPTNTMMAQPMVAQPMVAQPASTTAGGQFADWLYNEPVPPQYLHRSGLFGEFLYMRARNAEVAYALPIDGPVAPVLGNETPIGPTAVVDFEYKPNFRVGGAFAFNEEASIASQYTYFRSSTNSAASIDPAVGVLRSLVTHPLGANAATDATDANATASIDYDLIDTDFRGLVMGCESCEGKCASVVNYLIGGRYAQMEQDFGANFVALGTTSVNTNIDFKGGGIRLGLEGEQHATGNGLFAYGRGIANLMVGEFDATYTQANTFAGTQVFNSWSAGRVVPVFDVEVGVGWVGPRRRMKYQFGYVVSTWFNAVTTEDFIEAVQTSDYSSQSDTITFDGLTARATFEF